MMKFLRATPVLGLLGLALAIGGGCASAPAAPAPKPQSGSILDYFPVTPGLRLTYDFTSQLDPKNSGKRWITFQNPAQAEECSFQYRAVDSGAWGICIWKTGGAIIGASESRQNAYNDGGFRYLFMVNMPAQFQDGMDYSVNDIKYHVTTGNAWQDYPDCVKISFDSPDGWGPPWEQGKLGGTGYFLLAKDVGLVYLLFENRADKSIETFSLAEAPRQLAERRIFGRIQDSAGAPLPDVYVSLERWLGVKWCGKSDAAGDFSFNFYWEGGQGQGGMMVGFDKNENNVLDNNEIQIAWNYTNFQNEDLNMGTLTCAPLEYVDTGILEYNGHHYQILQGKFSWQEAEAWCENTLYDGAGGHLVFINDAAENDFIRQKYARLVEGLALGASDEAEEGTWVWADGSSVTYANWAQGEPNNYNDEDFAVMYGDGSWNDAQGGNAFVCEWDR